MFIYDIDFIMLMMLCFILVEFCFLNFLFVSCNLVGFVFYVLFLIIILGVYECFLFVVIKLFFWVLGRFCFNIIIKINKIKIK